MKVLVFDVFHTCPCLERSLDLAEIQAEEGNEVFYVNIGGHLPYLEWYKVPKCGYKKKLYKFTFYLKIKRAKRVVSPKIKISTNSLLSQKDIAELKQDLHFNNIEELKKYKWENLDIGMGAASSYLTDTQNLDPDTIKEAAHFNNIILSSKIVAKSFIKWLAKVEPGLVLFCNGRVANYRPLLRICQQKNQPFLTHERGCDKDHYSLWPTYIHDWDMRKEKMREHWINSKEADKEKIGREFFEERKQRTNKDRIVFAKNQKIGLLPPSWSDQNYNVVFFNSSISEFAAIDQEGNNLHKIYTSQEESIKDIERILAKKPHTKFYLRLHPNLLNKSETEKNIWMNMGSPHTELILPDDPIDTYSLIEKADLVICYLSTVGIEAAYYKTPCITLARSLYEGLDVTYNPSSKEELYDYLKAERLEPKPNFRALEYGFFLKTFGKRHKYFKAVKLQKGTFKGIDLQKYDYRRLGRMKTKLKRFKIKLTGQNNS